MCLASGVPISRELGAAERPATIMGNRFHFRRCIARTRGGTFGRRAARARLGVAREKLGYSEEMTSFHWEVIAMMVELGVIGFVVLLLAELLLRLIVKNRRTV